MKARRRDSQTTALNELFQTGSFATITLTNHSAWTLFSKLERIQSTEVVPSIPASFKRLSIDDQLGVVCAHTRMGRWMTPIPPGAACPPVPEGLLNSCTRCG